MEHYSAIGLIHTVPMSLKIIMPCERVKQPALHSHKILQKESRSAATWGREGAASQRAPGDFTVGTDACVHCLDLGDGFTGKYIWRNLIKWYVFNMCHSWYFSSNLIKLFLTNVKFVP